MSQLNDLITTPIYETTIPSTGKAVQFRPFVVREERALLMAQESENTNTMLNTLTKVVKGCLIGPPQELSTFDVEYLFIQIRIKSVDENSTLIFTCNACEEKTDINVPLKTAYVFKEPGHSTTFKLDDTLAVVMGYPSVEDLLRNDDTAAGVAASIKTIYKGDTVIDASAFTQDEMVEFLDTKLTGKQFEPLKKFYESIPEVRIDLKWKCPKCGHDHEQVLKGLNSFF